MKKNIFVVLLLLSVVFPTCTTKASADDVADFLRSTTGTVLGVALGPPIGGLRGLGSGWVKGTKATAEALGDEDGVAHNAIGFATGGVVGAAAGTVSGVLMGGYDGIRYGWDDPFSPNSYSAGGDDLLDYDPFAWE